MPYIRTIPPAEATGKLKEVMNPAPVLLWHRATFPWSARCKASIPTTSRPGAPSMSVLCLGEKQMRSLREMIAPVVSATNHCSHR